MNDCYEKTVRRLHGKVEMTFYEYTSDERSTPSLCEIKDNEFCSNVAIKDELRKNALNNLNVSGLTPEKKYITADGLSFPDGSCYPLPASNKTVIPLWSNSFCDEEGKFIARPTYVLSYPELREVGRFLIIGDEKWKQGPLQYNLNIYVPEGIEQFAEYSDVVLDGQYNIITAGEPEVSKVNLKIGEDSKEFNKLTFEITLPQGSDAARQCLKLNYMYPVIKAELEIIQWNAVNTAAKIIHFSDDIKFICQDNELQSISVLEEKTDGVDELSYGITSNTCTVKLLNKDNRFIRSPELLKKNRIVKPFVREEDDEKDWRELGKFFSDSWEISSTSDFVTCKAYDVLYNLQKMNLMYSMELVNGIYVMDGKVNGKNGTAYEIFQKIFRLINAQRKASGIFGSDIVPIIDSRLKKVTFDYVCLGSDTAWNMLQTMANASLSFVYVDRLGQIIVRRDDFADEMTKEYAPVDSGVSITPSNSFSYNLPNMSQALVNRVKVPYFTLDDKDVKPEDDQFTIEPKDFEYDENGKVVLNLSLKNFYPKIREIQLCNAKFDLLSLIPSKELEIAYSQIKIKLGKNVTDTQHIKVVPKNEIRYKQVKTDKIVDTYESQKKNGIEEFELKPENMIYGIESAKVICETILNKYGNGIPYIEAEWRGSSELELGTVIKSYSRKDPAPVDYECLSNDISYDGGLKFKTKARKIAVPD